MYAVRFGLSGITRVGEVSNVCPYSHSAQQNRLLTLCSIVVNVHFKYEDFKYVGLILFYQV